MTTRLNNSAISTTGNIIGNIAIANVIQTDNYQYANGQPFSGSNSSSSYGNANVVAYGETGWSGNIIPAANVTHSLGNSTNKWKDLYLSGNTIYLGDSTVSSFLDTTYGPGLIFPTLIALGASPTDLAGLVYDSGTRTLSVVSPTDSPPGPIGLALPASSTISLGDAVISTDTTGSGIVFPATVPVGGGTVQYSDGPEYPNSFTLPYAPTGSVIVTGVYQPGAPAVYITLDPSQYSIVGTTFTLTDDVTGGNWSLYVTVGTTATISGDSVSTATVTTGNIGSPDGTDLTVTGNLIVDGSLTVSPNSIYMGNVTLNAPSDNFSINSDGPTWAFDNTGNLTLPGNSFAVNYANGTQVTLDSGNGNSISNGTSNVIIADTDGNVVIGVDNDAMAWTFAIDGNIYAKSENNLTLVVADTNEDGLTISQIITDGNVEMARTELDSGQFSIYTDLPNGGYEWRFERDTLQVTNNSLIRGFDANVIIQSMFAGGNGTASLQSVSNQNDPNVFSTVDATTSGANIKVYNGGSNGGTEYAWTFDNTGNLNFPQGGYIGAAGAKGDGTMLTGGTGQLASLTSYYTDAPGIYSSCVTANPDGTLNITTYGNGTGQLGQWTFSGANLTLPTVSLGDSLDEQTVVQSQRRLIPPFRQSAVIDGATPAVVYTATNAQSTSMKVVVQVQHSGFGMEFFEVSATFTGEDTYYTVSNRVAPPSINTSTVLVDLNSSNAMQITITVNSGAATSWVTYDAVEFGIPND